MQPPPASPAERSGHPRGSREYRAILVALLCSGVATFAQLYAPQGILPLLSADLGIDASRASLTISAATTGLALSVLPWSLVADRIGRVRAMRVALVAATVCGLAAPWLPWFDAIVGVRVLEGVALGGVPGIAVAYLSEEVDPRHAAVAAGTYVSGTTLGGLAGRILAAPVADLFGWRLGVFSVSVLGALACLVFFAITPRPNGFTARPVSVPRVARAAARHMRDPRLVVLYAQGFLLMGGFVAVYNYLAFRLEAPPFLVPVGLASLLFLAYLAGTVTSRVAGGLVMRWGRKTVLLASIVVMLAGLAITLADRLPLVLVGLLVMTGGFFGAHSIASGWAGARAARDRSQSTALYNFWYYAGSSVFGYVGGFCWSGLGWPGVVALVAALAIIAAVWALAVRGDD